MRSKVPEICPLELFWGEHGYIAENLPTGAIVALCYLRECHKVIGDSNNALIGEELYVSVSLNLTSEITK